jgi:hypothetical protein
MAVKHAEGKSLFDQEKDYYKRIEEMQRDLSEDEKYESKELEGLEASLISLKKLLKINKSDQNAVDAILKDDVPNDVTTLGSADSTE